MQSILSLKKAKFHQQLTTLIEEGRDKLFQGKLTQEYKAGFVFEGMTDCILYPCRSRGMQVFQPTFLTLFIFFLLQIYKSKSSKAKRVHALCQDIPGTASTIATNLLEKLQEILKVLAEHMSTDIKTLVHATFERFAMYSHDDLEMVREQEGKGEMV